MKQKKIKTSEPFLIPSLMAAHATMATHAVAHRRVGEINRIQRAKFYKKEN